MSTTKPAVTAHAGAMGFADNSIEAMQAGVDAGADIVEFDLSFTPEGAAVLSHDAPQGVEPTLADAFDFLRRNPTIRANVDLKQMTDQLPAVQTAAQEAGVLERIFFTGIEEDWVPGVRRLCPKIPYYLNYGIDDDRRQDADYLAGIAELVKSLGALGLNIHHSGATALLADILHQRGLELSVWTVNDPEQIRRIAAIRPDNITSRRPDLVRAELGAE